jgi:hypothetical protein
MTPRIIQCTSDYSVHALVYTESSTMKLRFHSLTLESNIIFLRSRATVNCVAQCPLLPMPHISFSLINWQSKTLCAYCYNIFLSYWGVDFFGASGTITSSNSSWATALIVRASERDRQQTEYSITQEESKHTDAHREGKDANAGDNVLDEVRPPRPDQGRGLFVVLVIV